MLPPLGMDQFMFLAVASLSIGITTVPANMDLGHSHHYRSIHVLSRCQSQQTFDHINCIHVAFYCYGSVHVSSSGQPEYMIYHRPPCDKNTRKTIILNHINKLTIKVGDIYVANVIRNLPKQIICRSTKELPMRVANTNVTNGMKNAQKTIIWNRTNKLTMKVCDIYVKHVKWNLHIPIV